MDHEFELFNELFESPYCDKIVKVLPTLFHKVELENRRGKKIGMEVGTARERVLIAMFMYVYGKDSVKFPPGKSHGFDVIVNDVPISINTKVSKGFGGVKLSWTVDWEKTSEFVESFTPKSAMLFVQINWGGNGGMFLIPQIAQEDTLKSIGVERYVKKPPKRTNPRGIELSTTAMELLQKHSCTKVLTITWERDNTLPQETFQYDRWIELWEDS